MIPVPQSVLDSLASRVGTTSAGLSHFAGGRQDNDGVIYAYPYTVGFAHNRTATLLGKK